MYEELVNKKVKCVWRDGQDSKAIYGKVIRTDQLLITLIADKDRQHHYIAFSSVISISEVGG